MDPVIYPIGEYIEQPFSSEELRKRLIDIRFLSNHVENAITNLDEHQLDTSYREGGWTVKQVIHHLADSHMNAYIRSKLALTENNPIIKPYDQDAWAETIENKNLPVNISITLLHALHLKWHELFSNLKPLEWDRTVVHPEYNRQMSLWYILGLYTWHSKHHVAQIQGLRDRKRW